MNAEGLLHTSVDDCRSTLRCLVSADPVKALALIAEVYRIMNAHNCDDVSRRKVLATAGRLALQELTAKRISNSHR